MPYVLERRVEVRNILISACFIFYLLIIFSCRKMLVLKCNHLTTVRVRREMGKYKWRNAGNTTITKHNPPEAQINTTQTHKKTKDGQTKKTWTVFMKTMWWRGGGLKPVLFTRHLTLYSDAAPNYKYMFKTVESITDCNYNETERMLEVVITLFNCFKDVCHCQSQMWL